jgi:hypothetical protein
MPSHGRFFDGGKTYMRAMAAEKPLSLYPLSRASPRVIFERDDDGEQPPELARKSSMIVS